MFLFDLLNFTSVWFMESIRVKMMCILGYPDSYEIGPFMAVLEKFEVNRSKKKWAI